MTKHMDFLCARVTTDSTRIQSSCIVIKHGMEDKVTLSSLSDLSERLFTKPSSVQVFNGGLHKLVLFGGL